MTTDRTTSDVHRSLQIALVVITWVLLPLSFVHGGYLQDQPLHHIPTVVALTGLGILARKGVVSDASMVSILLFIWLHILGARYVYSNVPYDDWSRRLFAVSITETFHFSRNHYDRLVHFAYGVLAVAPQVELLRRRFALRRWPAHLLSIALVLAVGALYEIVEWTVAVLMAPDSANRYNGQQGDMWDSQKDMAMALLGAVVASAVVLAKRRRVGE